MFWKYTIKKFKSDLQKAIRLGEEELNNRKNGILGNGTIQEIEKILNELYEWDKKLINNQIGLKKGDYFSTLYTIIDSWDISHSNKFMDKIADIANKFDRLDF